MAVDLFQSRRTCNEFCHFWSRNEDEKYEADELVHKRTSSGSFWAEEMSPEQLKNNIIAGSFMFDSDHVTIRSPDDCSVLKQNDLVKYQGEIWIVTNVQRTKARKSQLEYAYDRNCSHYWYIELRK